MKISHKKPECIRVANVQIDWRGDDDATCKEEPLLWTTISKEIKNTCY